MKQRLYKRLAVLLAALMVLSMGVTVFASETPLGEQPGITQEEILIDPAADESQEMVLEDLSDDAQIQLLDGEIDFSQSASGDWNGIHWEYHNYALSLSGTGIIECPDYDSSTGYEKEWGAYTHVSREIVIEEGITGIADFGIGDVSELLSLSLPSTLEDDKVSDKAFYSFNDIFPTDLNGNVVIGGILFHHNFMSYPDEIFLSKEIRKISPMANIPYNMELKSFSVDPENPYYEAYNGALYDKGCKSLILLPRNYAKPEYTMPDTTNMIAQSLVMFEQLRTLAFGIALGFDGLSENGFNSEGYPWYPEKNVAKLYNTNLDSIIVPDNHPDFASENGVLYSKDKKSLYYYPRHAENASIGSSVTTIAYRSLYECNALQTLTFPDGVKELEGYAASGCDELTSVTFPASVTKIGFYALGNCYNLQEVRFLGSAPEIEEDLVGYRRPTQDPVTVYYPIAETASYEPYFEGGAKELSGVTWVAEGTLKAISDCTITLNHTSLTYNGKARKPTPTVKDGTKTLQKGTDYTVSYSNNTNAGTGKVIIKGKGAYTGQVTKTFKINKAPQTVTVKSNTYKRRFGCEPFTISASSDGTGKLVYASSNTSIATVTQKGKVTVKKAGSVKITIYAAESDNYKKSKSQVVTLSVLKAVNPIVVTPTSKTVKRSTSKNVSFKLTVKNAQGTVKYVSSNSKNVKVSSKGTVVVVKGAKRGKYKITVTAAGNTNYSKGTKTVTVTVK